DGNGRYLDGNALLAILALDAIDRGALPDNTVVTTIMANGGLDRAIAPQGGKVLRTRVGDRHVAHAMREHGNTIGGESSGHILLFEHNTTGDALIAALQILAIIVRRDQPLSGLAQHYQEMPEIHRKVSLKDRSKPAQELLDALVQEAESSLQGRGRIVIRPSGTEPIVRVMVQHEELRTAEHL